MTIEEEFFKAFGIEPKDLYGCSWDSGCPHPDIDCKTCGHWDKYDTSYPEITDRVLLELICILGTVIKQFKIPPHLNIKTLRGHILRNCINCQEGIYTRVCSLFEV